MEGCWSGWMRRRPTGAPRQADAPSSYEKDRIELGDHARASAIAGADVVVTSQNACKEFRFMGGNQK